MPRIATAVRFTIDPVYLQMLARDFIAAAEISCNSAYSPATAALLRQRGLKMLKNAGRTTLARDLELCRAFDGRTTSAITAPTLVICGEDDTSTPASQARDLARRISGARLLVVPRAGHMVMIEQPAIVSRAIRETIAGDR